MLLTATASSSSERGARAGMIASHAGEFNAHAALSRNVVSRSQKGVASPRKTSTPKAANSAAITSETTMRNRRASTTSARTPAGSVNRNIDRLLATCTAETDCGSAFSLVINHPEAVSYMAMPINAPVLASQITAKGRLRKTAHGERDGGVGLCTAFAFIVDQSRAPANSLGRSKTMWAPAPLRSMRQKHEAMKDHCDNVRPP